MKTDSSSSSNRVKCWLCNSWQSERYIVKMRFMGQAEDVCFACKNRLDARDDSLEIERQRYEEAEKARSEVRDISTEVKE